MKNRKTTFVKTVGNLAVVAGVFGAIVAMPQISSAATTPKPGTAMMAEKPAPKTTQVTGTITSIKGEELTIVPVRKKKKGASVTVNVRAEAKVKIDGKPAKLSELKVGDRVTIKMSGSNVTSVTLSTVKKSTAKKASPKTPKE
ncbi:MAG: hypothetical protein ABI210_08400 [Abditibacteriaceae bacterium]